MTTKEKHTIANKYTELMNLAPYGNAYAYTLSNDLIDVVIIHDSFGNSIALNVVSLFDNSVNALVEYMKGEPNEHTNNILRLFETP